MLSHNRYWASTFPLEKIIKSRLSWVRSLCWFDIERKNPLLLPHYSPTTLRHTLTTNRRGGESRSAIVRFFGRREREKKKFAFSRLQRCAEDIVFSLFFFPIPRTRQSHRIGVVDCSKSHRHRAILRSRRKEKRRTASSSMRFHRRPRETRLRVFSFSFSTLWTDIHRVYDFSSRCW